MQWSTGKPSEIRIHWVQVQPHSTNSCNLCRSIQLPLLDPARTTHCENGVCPQREKRKKRNKRDMQKWSFLFSSPEGTLSEERMEASTKQCIRETFKKKALRTVPSLKLISFLRPPVYPLQIPKPPSVILTNEAIKFRVANSFELHLLSKSFNIPTTASPSLSRLFAMLGSLLTRDHRLTLFCHSFPEGKEARRREMGREIPPA